VTNDQGGHKDMADERIKALWDKGVHRKI